MKTQEKVKKADDYASKFESDPEGFVSSIKENPGTLVGLTYEESWEYMRHGNHSLEPHTNINILLDRLIEESNS